MSRRIIALHDVLTHGCVFAGRHIDVLVAEDAGILKTPWMSSRAEEFSSLYRRVNISTNTAETACAVFEGRRQAYE